MTRRLVSLLALAGCFAQSIPQAVAQIGGPAVRSNALGGNPQAQFMMGESYRLGAGGFERSDKEAAVWYRKAAEQGHLKAQYQLANIYNYGRGVPKDAAQAISWYRKAADQGDVSSQFALGEIFDEGRGVPKDPVQAVVWYRKAADQGEQGGPVRDGVCADHRQRRDEGRQGGHRMV